MKKLTSLSLAAALFALVVPACASDSSGTNDDDDIDDDTEETTPPPPTPKMDVTGNYRVYSTFDVAANMPADSFLNGLISATDGAADPMHWVLDQLASSMQPGWQRDLLIQAIPLLAPELNNQITQLAPDLVNTLRNVGQRTAELYKKFGVNEALSVRVGAGADVTLVGKWTFDAVRFEVNGVATDYPLNANDIDNVITDNISITYGSDANLTVATRTLPVPYGKVIRIGFDNAVVPAVDPTANSLAELLANQIDCMAVGEAVQNWVGLGGTGFWTAACGTAMGFAADALYDQLIPEETMINLNMSGTSRALDTNNDYRIDKIQFGKWTGLFGFAGADTNLAQPAIYNGERLVQPL